MGVGLLPSFEALPREDMDRFGDGFGFRVLPDDRPRQTSLGEPERDDVESFEGQFASGADGAVRGVQKSRLTP